MLWCPEFQEVVRLAMKVERAAATPKIIE
uniref:Uncharacterized protein n=1 Tax=Rhizophora mucronata TaxID=61149 RepID=A0A2P2Q219_RHIMU